MPFIVLAAGSLGTLKVCIVLDMSFFLSLICSKCQSCCWLLLLSGGMLLLELNRLLRPGGYFVWSATPVYQKLAEDVEIWNGIFTNCFLKFYPNWMKFLLSAIISTIHFHPRVSWWISLWWQNKMNNIQSSSFNATLLFLCFDPETKNIQKSHCYV